MNRGGRESSWGKHSLELCFPFGTIEFTNLSLTQRNGLKSIYREFVNDKVEFNSENLTDLSCVAFRLTSPPSLTLDELSTSDHFYCPDKQRDNNKLAIIGHNFEASIGLGTDQRTGTLGISYEQDIFQLDVVENYLRILASYYALNRKGVLLHSAGLVVENRAYLFVGRSGAGKTTLTRKGFSAGAHVLSDDMNLLVSDKTVFNAHTIPFSGEFGRTINLNNSPRSFPVFAICFLKQSDVLGLNVITEARASSNLLINAPFVNEDECEFENLLDVISDLTGHIPTFELETRKDSKFLDIVSLINSGVTNNRD